MCSRMSVVLEIESTCLYICFSSGEGMGKGRLGYLICLNIYDWGLLWRREINVSSRTFKKELA